MSDPEFPDTSLPQGSPEERLTSLESSVSTLLQQSQTTAAALTHVLTLVTPAAPAVTLVAPVAPPITSTPTAPLAAAVVIPLPTNLAALPAFLMAFTAQTQAEAKAAAEAKFPDDHIKIGWAMTYMQLGQAADLVAHIFEHGGIKKAFQDWDHFVSVFGDEFYDPNEVANASLALESLGYFQNGRSIDQYIDSFKALWYKSGYPDGRHLVIKFHHGPDFRLNCCLGTITTGRPHESQVNEWFHAAHLQDFLM
ncbi:hypothetical protein DXG03_006051 [Asterophora parasitica]|uniref:Retrotransposon gag domain-containing protein n=1 Tax=Asterophora parasitica TaxID=117018 RepID=A0A9P7K9F7_9AGAR|nr:hypothetical protein DXG03_006051 [Asterophora parasitica]